MAAETCARSERVMKDDASSASELVKLRQRVAQLERDLLETQRTLARTENARVILLAENAYYKKRIFGTQADDVAPVTSQTQ